jgi:predicted nucleic acid-binding protein
MILRKITFMIKEIYFDTDCLASFLWVKEHRILLALYPGRIHVPQAVYDELSFPGIEHLKAILDILIKDELIIMDIFTPGSDEEKVYYHLAYNPGTGHKLIGKGEASAIALSKERKGILASNNLKDVQLYIDLYGLESLTTSTIMIKALKEALISEEDANRIWKHMILKKRKLPYDSFTEFKNTMK